MDNFIRFIYLYFFMTRNDLTEIVIILDESGSMSGTESTVISKTNTLISEQQKIPGDANITIYKFSTSGHGNYIMFRQNLQNAKVSDDDYKPGGQTALHDAIGKVITEIGLALSKMREHERPGKVFMSIITDGQENDSNEFTGIKVAEMIKHQQEKYNWHIEYVTIGFENKNLAKSMNISMNNYMYAPGGASGVSQLYSSMGSSLTSFRTSKDNV
jgi:uncharacterized protein YegL